MTDRKLKIKYLFGLFIFQIIMILFITPLLVNYLFYNDDNLIVDVFSQLLSFILPICLILIFSSKKINFEHEVMLFQVNTLYKSKINIKAILYSFLIGILLSFTVNYLFHFFEILYILLSDDYSIISLIPPFNLKSFLGAILILGILPSLFEELLYRGMDLGRFLGHFLIEN